MNDLLQEAIFTGSGIPRSAGSSDNLLKGNPKGLNDEQGANYCNDNNSSRVLDELVQRQETTARRSEFTVSPRDGVSVSFLFPDSDRRMVISLTGLSGQRQNEVLQINREVDQDAIPFFQEIYAAHEETVASIRTMMLDGTIEASFLRDLESKNVADILGFLAFTQVVTPESSPLGNLEDRDRRVYGEAVQALDSHARFSRTTLIHNLEHMSSNALLGAMKSLLSGNNPYLIEVGLVLNPNEFGPELIQEIQKISENQQLPAQTREIAIRRLHSLPSPTE